MLGQRTSMLCVVSVDYGCATSLARRCGDVVLVYKDADPNIGGGVMCGVTDETPTRVFQDDDARWHPRVSFPSLEVLPMCIDIPLARLVLVLASRRKP